MTTAVDLAVERMVREFLREATPTIGFLGEEEGGADAQTRWVLDPIDGTANFARGLPLNGVSLALLHETHAVLGVITLPFLDLRYWAADGLGAWRNCQPITAVSGTPKSCASKASSSDSQAAYKYSSRSSLSVC
jgi:myo-inositol-1(or 4)-monophosphatase